MHMSVPMGSFTDFKPLSFFQNRLIKRKVCCSEIRGKFFGSDKNLTFSVYFKSFFLDMGIFPKKHLKRRI